MKKSKLCLLASSLILTMITSCKLFNIDNSNSGTTQTTVPTGPLYPNLSSESENEPPISSTSSPVLSSSSTEDSSNSNSSSSSASSSSSSTSSSSADSSTSSSAESSSTSLSSSENSNTSSGGDSSFSFSTFKEAFENILATKMIDSTFYDYSELDIELTATTKYLFDYSDADDPIGSITLTKDQLNHLEGQDISRVTEEYYLYDGVVRKDNGDSLEETSTYTIPYRFRKINLDESFLDYEIYGNTLAGIVREGLEDEFMAGNYTDISYTFTLDDEGRVRSDELSYTTSLGASVISTGIYSYNKEIVSLPEQR